MEIPQNSTQAEIKTKYKQLVLKHHPDRNKDSNATKKFIEMQEAYKYLRRTPTEQAKIKTNFERYNHGFWSPGNFSTSAQSSTWTFTVG